MATAWRADETQVRRRNGPRAVIGVIIAIDVDQVLVHWRATNEYCWYRRDELEVVNGNA